MDDDLQISSHPPVKKTTTRNVKKKQSKTIAALKTPSIQEALTKRDLSPFAKFQEKRASLDVQITVANQNIMPGLKDYRLNSSLNPRKLTPLN